MTPLRFTVYGVAQPKGNMKAYVPRGMKFPVITDSNRNARSWAQLVAEGASRAIAGLDDRSVLTEGVRVSVAFYLPRPKKYQRRGVPRAHLVAPDIDKLLRSVLDALSGVVWVDDSQIVDVVTVKRYADMEDAPHVTIGIEPSPGIRAVPPAEALPSLFDEACDAR
jgi:crossover junction endodeoxyribonuclease RusA